VAQAVISGIAGTDEYGAARLQIDVSSEIARLEPSEAPFLALLRQLNVSRKAGTNPKRQWLEKEPSARWTTISHSGGYDAAATSIDVADGSRYHERDVLCIPRTGEHLYVSAVSGNTLTVVRGFGESAAAAINDGDNVFLLGTCNEENATMPPRWAEKSVEEYNFFQDFRRAFGASDMAEASEYYQESPRVEMRRDRAIEHNRDIELSLLFGERYEDKSGAQPKRTLRGIWNYVTTNVTTVSTTLTESVWDAWIQKCFTYGLDSRSKIVFCAPIFLSAIDNWAKGRLQVSPLAERYGVRIMQYESAHGTVQLVKHPLFTGSVGTNRLWGGCAICVDMSRVQLVYYRDIGPTRLRTNIQENDRTGWVDEYRTVLTVEVRNEKAHAKIQGVGAYA